MGIRLLARELNLSIGTVSRALNDRPDVNETTRARVKEAARLSGYVPDQSGRSLRKGRTGIIAAVVPTSGIGGQTDGGFFQILEGCRRELLRHELDLIVLFRGPEEDPLESLRRIVSRHLADAIIINQTRESDPRIAYMRDFGVEYVALGRAGQSETGSWVDFDYDAAGTQAARLFLREGHRRLALVLSDLAMNYEGILTEAFRREVAAHGLGADAVRVVRACGGRLTEEGWAVFGSDRRPTAVLAAHEGIASALFGDLGALGLRPGVDVGLICASPAVDNHALEHALTHFDIDLDAAGRAVAERLVALLPETGMPREPLPPALVPMRLVSRVSHRVGGAAFAATRPV